MSSELTYLTWSAGLCAVLWMPYMLARFAVWGIPATVAYPDNPPMIPAWAQRAQRAHLNMVENLAPFAALVLVAQVAGLTSATTATGAAIFFWAKLVHVIVHILGVPWVRTLAFLVAWLGMAMIFVAIVTH